MIDYGYKIDRIADYWIESIIEQTPISAQVPKQERLEVKEALKAKAVEDIKNEICDLLTEEEKKRILSKAKRETFQSVLVDGLIVAFFVGLLVNQITNIFDLVTQNNAVAIAVFIGILFFILFLIIQLRVIRHIFWGKGE